MRRNFILLSLLCGFALQGMAQQITEGPVLGGVGPQSARLYYRTDVPATLSIDVDTDSLFSAPLNFSNTTNAAGYLAAITDLTGLQADTRYYYRVFVNGVQDSLRGSFRTFPPEGQSGYYRVVVGSCNYHDFYPGGGATSTDNYYNDILFGGIRDFDPRIVLHLGDWNYPPSAFGAAYNTNPSLRAASFALRYRDYNMRTHITPSLPVDYVYDDDYSQNGNAGWTYPTITPIPGPFGSTAYQLDDPALPAGVREGAITAYFDHFPGYAQVDTSGVHHSFKLGNIEFFVLDTRSSKDPVHEVFTYNSILGTHSFNPPTGHSTLGPAQKQWLLDGLRNSTADWKVICSSVVFNQNFGTLMSLLEPAQIADRSFINLMASIAYMWPGYPEDSQALLDLIQSEDIRNVVLLSGDTHSSMMDDGTNSGIPELSASGWAAGNEAYLNQTIDSVVQQFSLGNFGVKDFLWNGGGNGIENNSRNDSYGTLEFFGTDSLRMCVIDEFNQTLACMTLLYDNGSATGSHFYVPPSDMLLIYPNPAKDRIRVQLSPDFMRENMAVRIWDGEGKSVLELKDLSGPDLLVSLETLPQGLYVMEVDNGERQVSRKFIRH